MASLNPATYHGLDAPRRDRSGQARRHPRPRRPRVVRAGASCSSAAGRRSRRSRRSRCPTGSSDTVHMGAIDAGVPRGAVARRPRAGDRARPGPDHHRVARGRAHDRRRPRGRRPGARPGEDRRLRAPPPDGPGRARVRPRLRARSAARSGRPSPTTRTTSSSSASTTRSIVTVAEPAARPRRRPRRGRRRPDVLAELPLPVAGLLSDRPLAEVLDCEPGARRPRSSVSASRSRSRCRCSRSCRSR